jgi:hypothetical protein
VHVAVLGLDRGRRASFGTRTTASTPVAAAAAATASPRFPVDEQQIVVTPWSSEADTASVAVRSLYDRVGFSLSSFSQRSSSSRSESGSHGTSRVQPEPTSTRAPVGSSSW